MWTLIGEEESKKLSVFQLHFLHFTAFFYSQFLKKGIGYTKKFVGIPSEMDVVLLQFQIFKRQLIMLDFKK